MRTVDGIESDSNGQSSPRYQNTNSPDHHQAMLCSYFKRA